MHEATKPQLEATPAWCAQFAARAGGAWWRRVFETSPLAQAIFTPREGGVIANEAFAAQFRTTVDALLELSPEALLVPDERDCFAEDVDAISDELPRLSVERTFVRADDSVFVGWAAMTTLPDPAGDRPLAHLTLEDATWHLGASRGLARVAARSLELIDNSPDIVAVLYPDGEWEASSEGTRALGYPKGFSPPGGVFSLVHPDDVLSASSALEELLAGTRWPNATVELRLRAADGTYREFECAGRDLTRDRRVGGIIVTARDVSTRKRIERALRHAEERFRVIFEEAPLVISLVDLDGRILDINRAGCALLGRSRESLVGTAAELTVHPDDRESAIDATTRQLSGEEDSAEFRLVTADKREVPVLSRAALVATGDDGEDPYIVTLQTDITERKHREADLHTRATYDALTGLLRRSVVVDRLEQALTGAPHDRFSVIFLDLDDFKAINDAYGHEAGDEVLRRTAQRISDRVRVDDCAARFGGDEFVVLCRGVRGAGEAHAIAERIRRAIAQPVAYRDQLIPVNASAGLTLSRADDDSASVIRRADTAVYRAKAAGKAQTQVLFDEMPPAPPARASADEASGDPRDRISLPDDDLPDHR